MIRLATYNVENLFSRPVLFNMKDQDKAAAYLKKISDFTRFLAKESYADDKQEIENLYEEIREYIIINLRASKVGRYIITKNGLIARGREDWDGFIDLKRERFENETVEFTAKVIRAVKADIQCLVEVESADTLKLFNTHRLSSAYADRIVIDGNDPRGIDIALGTRRGLPIVTAKTNIFARGSDNRTIFSRDCLEVEVKLPDAKNLFVLVNHFKAKDATPATSDKKRLEQATEVSRILRDRYNLNRDYVVVAGDLNDEPDSAPLQPLVATPGLHNVLDVINHPADDRWTYFYGREKSYNVIDYLFVSEALRSKVRAAGLERRGMFDLSKLTNGAQASFPGIDNWKLAGSDHALVWVDLDID